MQGPIFLGPATFLKSPGLEIPDFQLQHSRSKLKFIFPMTKVFLFYRHGITPYLLTLSSTEHMSLDSVKLSTVRPLRVRSITFDFSCKPTFFNNVSKKKFNENNFSNLHLTRCGFCNDTVRVYITEVVFFILFGSRRIG